jgi:hypothetical protein
MNTADGGAGSLRGALANANDGDTINFDVSVTGIITLTSGQLEVNENISISGPSAKVLAITANTTTFRVFYIASGKTVAISGLTITGGIKNNGGGIYNDHSTLTIDNCSVSGNGAYNWGAGLYNDHGTLTVSNSLVSNNVASGSPSRGGGIFNDGSSGSATLIVNNSTFSGFGTIIHNDGTLEIGNTIIEVTQDQSIVNVGTVTSLGYNLSNDDAGGDATTGPGGLLNAAGDIRNTDPMLGPLQDNGGPTWTHALLSGSLAIDHGDPNFTPPPDYDQRGAGYPRIVNSRIDIGAFEVQATVYAAQVQQPINADATSVFNVKRGVVPVKFTLTLNGVPTCNLPPATIAVTRTAGGTLGSIDESIYTGPADTGSSFRISSCQYVYNLSASALTIGTYRVDHPAL